MILDQRNLVGGQTPEEVAALWEKIAAMSTIPRVLVESGESLTAYVSENRWCADCPGCRSGIAAWPDNPRGCCFGCYTIYPITFPAEIERATAALEARPIDNRNWMPGETAEELEAENEAHAEELL